MFLLDVKLVCCYSPPSSLKQDASINKLSIEGKMLLLIAIYCVYCILKIASFPRCKNSFSYLGFVVFELSEHDNSERGIFVVFTRPMCKFRDIALN